MRLAVLVVVALGVPFALLACGDDGAGADSGRLDGGAPDSAADAGRDAAPVDAAMPVIDGGAPCIGCGACLDGDVETTEFEQMLIELPGASWLEAPDTPMRTVCVDDSVGVRGIVGCAAAISAWSGGAYDSGRRRMLVWGGGHDDYWGNELYAFDLGTGTWQRITEPSTIPAGTSTLASG